MIGIALSSPTPYCVKGTYAGTLSDEWDSLSDFYGNLYPHLVRNANQNKLAIDPADVAAGVEASMVANYLEAYALLQWLNAVKLLGDDSNEPLFQEWSSYVNRRRHAVERIRGRAASFPFPEVYKQAINYVFTPVSVGPGTPILMAQYGTQTRATRKLDSTTDVDTVLAAADTAMDSIEDSADKLKVLNALQSFRPAWATPLPDLHAQVDPERVLMWQTRALRNTNGVTDRQNPNLEDSAFGDGQRVTIFSRGNPHALQFTGLVPSITYEKDDKGSGDASFGMWQLSGAAADDADLPSEVQVVSGRTSPTITDYPLDYAQSVTDKGTKPWNHWIYGERGFQDDPADYLAERAFEQVQYYQIDLDEIAVETRKMVVGSWGFPL